MSRGKKFAELRKQRDLSQEQLARLADVVSSTISKIESRDHGARKSNMIDLFVVLHQAKRLTSKEIGEYCADHGVEKGVLLTKFESAEKASSVLSLPRSTKISIFEPVANILNTIGEEDTVELLQRIGRLAATRPYSAETAKA